MPDPLDWLRAGEGRLDLPIMLVVAHPDDEVIGVGSRLPRLERLEVLYLTDGAPGRRDDPARLAYAAVRAREAEAGLALCGIGPAAMSRLGFVDQETPFRLRELALAVHAALRRFRPAVVLTHPFENGHPDHDSAAFAVHQARRLLLAAGEPAPALVEFASYHDPDGSGAWAVQSFLPGGTPALVLPLTAAEQALKRRLLACHATQEAVLRGFPTDREAYREAPAYDFLAAPHPWRPLYEGFIEGMTRERWQGLAASALDALARC